MSEDGAAPIIVTAELARADQAWADALRRRYFPPERNVLAAHITLFHHLPPSCEAELLGLLSALTRQTRPAARNDRLLSLGRGVALHVDSPALRTLREELAVRFHGLLTPQDAAPLRLHITIQNKVTDAVARATLAELARDFIPRPLHIAGLAAWHYRGGPWSLIRRYAFRG